MSKHLPGGRKERRGHSLQEHYEAVNTHVFSTILALVFLRKPLSLEVQQETISSTSYWRELSTDQWVREAMAAAARNRTKPTPQGSPPQH